MGKGSQGFREVLLDAVEGIWPSQGAATGPGLMGLVRSCPVLKSLGYNLPETQTLPTHQCVYSPYHTVCVHTHTCMCARTG